MSYCKKIVSVSAAVLLLTAFTVSAQQSMPQDAAPVEVPVEKLEKFVDAQKSILTIQEKYTSQMDQVEDPQQSKQLRQKANQEMIGAVEKAGLDVESYNQIAMAVRSDPDLQKQIEDMN